MVHDQFPSSLEKTQKWLQRRIDKGLTKKAGKAKKQQVEPIRLKGNGIGAILQMPPPPKEGKQPKPKERAEESEPPEPSDGGRSRPSSREELQDEEDLLDEPQASQELPPDGADDGSHDATAQHAPLVEVNKEAMANDAMALERQAAAEAARLKQAEMLTKDITESLGSAFGPGPNLAGGVSKAKGWKILRDYMKEYMDHRSAITDQVLTDVIHPTSKPNRIPETAKLDSVAAADRAFDMIIAAEDPLDPRGQENTAVWTKAKQSYMDLTQTFLAIGYNPQVQPKKDEKEGQAAGHATAEQRHLGSGLFPNQWWQTLSEELIAELVVDDLADKMAEVLFDSAVAIVEEEIQVAEDGWLQFAAEEEATLLATAPELPDEWSIRPPQLASSASAPALGSKGGSGHRSMLPQTMPAPRGGKGFNQQGLPTSWATRRYHPCQQLDPIASRVKADIEAQRPKRQVKKLETEDQRKFVWPMTASNFPDKWETVTKKKATKPGAPLSLTGDESFLCRVGSHGKTEFPYSLALHKAFLESQSDPLLKEKAAKLAPIRLSKDLL